MDKKYIGIFSLLLVFTSFFSPIAWAQGENTFTLSGTITDKQNGETLIGATIYFPELKVGTVSNVYGFYSASVPSGTYKVVFSFIGYEAVETTISLIADRTLNMELGAGSTQLKEVEISAKRPDANVKSIEMSTVTLQMSSIKEIPALFGEVDVIKAIQLLPGVASAGEGFSGFFVRGGNSDQNLVLLDEAPVYNASHLLGFFSVFNPDAVKDVKLYKGGIPAEYGGRLSSVLDVRMNEGNRKKFEGSAGIGTISSRLTLQAPINKGKGSFLVSGRRTYLDLFLKLSKDPDNRNTKLYFYDFNAKANYQITEKDRVFLSGYFGRDVFAFGNGDAIFSWGNGTGTARWNHIYNNRLFSNVTLLYSNYDYLLGFNNGDDEFKWRSNIEDISAKVDFNYFINSNSTLKFGGGIIKHNFNPGNVSVTSTDIDVNFNLYSKQAIETGFYVSNEHNFNSRITALYGLRYSSFHNLGGEPVFTYDENHTVKDTTNYSKNDIYNTYSGFEPRLGLKYQLDSVSSVKGSYNLMRQYVQLASNSNAASPLDIWFPASQTIKPQIAHQVALGYFRNFKNNIYEFSTEVYYKKILNAVDFKNQADLLLNQQLEGEIRTGTAEAYGLELFLRKNEGRLTGFFSATFSAVNKKIDVDDLSPGIEKFPAKYSKPLDFALVVSYQVNKRLSLSANAIYSSGLAITVPTSKYYYKGSVIPVYSSRNGARIPAYHRMDLSCTLKSKKNEQRRLQAEWVFSIYNVYNRHNAFSVNFVEDQNNPGTTIAEKFYLFPILPSITYNLHF